MFKIETVGDCYVAVTGLPEAQSSHAINMAKFAQDCVDAMGSLVADQLMTMFGGNDTARLAIRVGMHSGSVTAGVLRGEKSRFQMFGDTVNVAARMESTGVPGRIQASEDCANELIERGFGNWTKARDEYVAVKGKGKPEERKDVSFATRERMCHLPHSQLRQSQDLC